MTWASDTYRSEAIRPQYITAATHNSAASQSTQFFSCRALPIVREEARTFDKGSCSLDAGACGIKYSGIIP